MLTKFADPKTDFVFKRIFGAPAHRDILIAFLNDLLELEGPRRITEVVHLPPEQRVAVDSMKLSIVDVKCTDSLGRHFVVEMQVLYVADFEKRVVYNVAKAYTLQLKHAETYPSLSDVIGVSICDFSIWPDQADQQPIPMHSRWRMREEHSHSDRGLGQLQLIFLELPKYAAGSNPTTMVDKWAYFFREADKLEVVPPALAQGAIAQALELANTAAFTAQEWDEYERAKLVEEDARGAVRAARDSGRAEGRAGMLLGQLTFRFGELPESARARVAAASENELERWAKRIFTAASIEEVLDS
jgi:predicted transposase/invertase (TIGR01784 family)